MTLFTLVLKWQNQFPIHNASIPLNSTNQESTVCVANLISIIHEIILLSSNK